MVRSGTNTCARGSRLLGAQCRNRFRVWLRGQTEQCLSLCETCGTSVRDARVCVVRIRDARVSFFCSIISVMSNEDSWVAKWQRIGECACLWEVCVRGGGVRAPGGCASSRVVGVGTSGKGACVWCVRGTAGSPSGSASVSVCAWGRCACVKEVRVLKVCVCVCV